MDKKISIILPVYKVENYLDKCLSTLINQTYKNLEIILVDDGSPDNSGQHCDEWAKRDKRIKVFHKENGGVSSARNLGIKKATGEYVCFVDPDDYVDLSMYEKLLTSAEINNSDLVMCRYYNVFENNNKIQKVYEENFLNINTENIFNLFLLNKNKVRKNIYYRDSVMGCLWRCLFKKDLIKNIELENVRIAEDLIFMIDVFKKKPKLSLVDEYLYYYLQRETSAMHKVSMEAIRNRVHTTELIEERTLGLVDPAIEGASKFCVYGFCIKHMIGQFSVKEMKTFANEKYVKSMNSDQNYKNHKRNAGFGKRIYYHLIHKEKFWLCSFLIQLYRKVFGK